VNELTTLFIIEDEVPAEDAWRLLEWCRRVGADEFSLLIVQDENVGKARDLSIEQELAAFEREPAPREGVMAMQGEEWVRPVPLWSLTPASIRQLQRVLPDGLFSWGVWTKPVWCENLCLYRNAELMLGVVTHEHMAVVRVTPSEREELEGLGIRCHSERSFTG
jgi:hypothetical protein